MNIKTVLFCILLCATIAEAQVSRVSNRNSSLTVSAGANQTITLPGAATLAGNATLSGSVVALPKRSTVSVNWTATGPAAVTFANPAALSTSASFSTAGVYALRLTATSSTKLTTSSSIVITVNPAVVVVTPPPPKSNNLAWDPVPGVDGYNLYRTDGGCDDLSTFQKANAQLITAIPYGDDPTPAGAWCYYVRAVSAGIESDASNVIWVPTK